VNEDDHSGSLADQAAAWVPPWERVTNPPAETPAETSTDAPAETSAETSADAPAEDLAATDAALAPAASAEEAWTAEDAGIVDEFGTVQEIEVEPADTKPADTEPAAFEPAEVEVDPTPPPDARPANLTAALEAILLVLDEPVPTDALAEVLAVPVDEMILVLEQLSAAYTSEGRGFDLRRAAGGWRLYTRGEYASYVERFILDGQSVRLTQAALETLAVIAYQQPVTRSRMSAIRGVNCDGVVRTLSNRGLIEECGTQPESGAFLYRTTLLFLEKLGLDSLDELPPLAPFLPDDVNGFVDA
jgi:segregation and condensation protein B